MYISPSVDERGKLKMSVATSLLRYIVLSFLILAGVVMIRFKRYFFPRTSFLIASNATGGMCSFVSLVNVKFDIVFSTNTARQREFVALYCYFLMNRISNYFFGPPRRSGFAGALPSLTSSAISALRLSPSNVCFLTLYGD